MTDVCGGCGWAIADHGTDGCPTEPHPDRRLVVNPEPLRTVPARGQVPAGILEGVHRCRRCRMVRAWCECPEGFADGGGA